MGRIKDKNYVDPKDVYQYLVGTKGISEAHALGILANIQAESAFNSAAIGDKGTSGGLFQHHASRFTGLKQYAGADWTNWQKQVDFALSEGATKKYVNKEFKTPEEASMWWTTEWERPADKYEKAKQRVNNINKFTHFTQYEATPYEGGTDQNPNPENYNPGVISVDAARASQPVTFELVLPTGTESVTVDPADFKKELDKVKIIEKKVEESPERLKIEAKKEERQMFLNAVGAPNDVISYYPDKQRTAEQAIVEAEVVQPLEATTQLPTLPSIFQVNTPSENI